VTGTKQSLKMLKLLRMTKLFRLFRINRLFQHIKRVMLLIEETLNVRISDGFTKLTRLGVGALILAHWIGCFNFMLVRLNDFPPDSWVVYSGLEDKSPSTQWSWSFFKALAQMIMIGFETPP
jgi:hyperpolarization activated cyclic nucleotide-gated potassium channel 2